MNNKFKNDNRYTENGYFNLNGYLKNVGLDPHTKTGICIITAERGMGKSYGAWDYIDKEIWQKYDYKWKIAYTRTNDVKMKKTIASFNEHYKGKYVIISEFIYKIPEGYFNEDKKINIVSRVDKSFIEIGRIVNVKNEENFRSGVKAFENYHFFFWDEFNEVEQTEADKDVYANFLNLMSTVMRQNEPFFVLLVGNKNNANNDIFTSLELDYKHDFNEDFIQHIENDIKYIDIGRNTFKHLNPDDKLINRLAKYNAITDEYFNHGGFLNMLPPNICYASELKDKQVLKYFSADTFYFEYGTFINKDGEQCFFFNEITMRHIPKDTRLIALNTLGYLQTNTKKLWDKQDYKDMVEKWINMMRCDRLFYTSFNAKTILEACITRLYNIFDEQ